MNELMMEKDKIERKHKPRDIGMVSFSKNSYSFTSANVRNKNNEMTLKKIREDAIIPLVHLW